MWNYIVYILVRNGLPTYVAFLSNQHTVIKNLYYVVFLQVDATEKWHRNNQGTNMILVTVWKQLAESHASIQGS